MKNQILLISIFVLTIFLLGAKTASAQNYKQSGKNLTEICTDRAFVIAEGDINKDGIKDVILSREHAESAIYFGKSDGGYTLFHEYDFVLSKDDKITINDKGVLRIQIDFNDGSDIFLFRYQNGGLQLIGGKKDRHKSSHYDYSYNFSTGKMIKTEGEGANKTSVTETMPKQPVLKFGWIPLRWDMVDYLFETFEDGEGLASEDMLAYGIFRRIQNAEMMHWSMCDHESYYGKALRDGENGEGWSAYGSYESPGSYNNDTYLTIKKQKNGTYKIYIKETSQDRSYESQINEDYSNLDEIDIPDAETFETTFIFDDGNFIEQK
ncbi:MAG: hypothetical protein IKQ46_02070 [Bacteroidales bacterium]|jgi:hypothetical protein|nr:hypothetical protein [Bacteroidales bacterium]